MEKSQRVDYPLDLKTKQSNRCMQLQQAQRWVDPVARSTSSKWVNTRELLFTLSESFAIEAEILSCIFQFRKCIKGGIYLNHSRKKSFFGISSQSFPFVWRKEEICEEDLIRREGGKREKEREREGETEREREREREREGEWTRRRLAAQLWKSSLPSGIENQVYKSEFCEFWRKCFVLFKTCQLSKFLTQQRLFHHCTSER